MFLPIGVEAEVDRQPVATYGLIVALTLTHFINIGLSDEQQLSLLYALGCVPHHIRPHALFTATLVHGDLFHLLGNLLYLWVFGRLVESSWGTFRFLALFFGYGAVANLAQALFTPGFQGDLPVIGASGSISAVLGAFWLLHPNVAVRIFFIPLWRSFPIAAGWGIGLWFAGQFLDGVLSILRSSAGVAFWAHIGGFLAGAAGVVWDRHGGSVRRAFMGQAAERWAERLNADLRDGRAEAAVAPLLDLSAAAPESPVVRLEFGRACLVAGRLDEARRAFSFLLRRSLDGADDLLAANAFWGLRRSGGTDRLPSDTLAAVGEAFLRRGRGVEAAAILEPLADARGVPALDRILVVLGRALSGRDPRRAAALLRRVTDEHPRSACVPAAVAALRVLEAGDGGRT